MKRPFLVHFLAIMTEEHLNIKASVTMKENLISQGKNLGLAREVATGIVKEIEKEIPKPRFPIQALRLLSSSEFKLKIIGLDSKQNEIYKKTFDSDGFGNFNFKIPLNEHRKKVVALQVYEVSKQPGLEIHLGTFIPLKINDPKKIIICDFDKTLVDTKYSTTREVYTSLTQPLEYFPTVTNSVDILRKYLDDGYHPFILSASPHFYEDAMRDWLYKNKIFTAGIFLKDYRQIFSLLELDLTPKDLKLQGLYKLNHLLDILLMTGIPDHLVLMGDNFESDPIIYLSLAKLLVDQMDPWKLWNLLQNQKGFEMNRKQNSQVLNKVYQLSNNIKDHNNNGPKIELEIYIRKKVAEDKLDLPTYFDKNLHLVQLYEGLKPQIALEKTAKLTNND